MIVRENLGFPLAAPLARSCPLPFRSRPRWGRASVFGVPPTHSISTTTLWGAVRCGRAL